MKPSSYLLAYFAPFCLLPVFSHAQTLQNYVRNPSFEQYKTIPTDLGALNLATFNNSATQATADYFHARCQNPEVDVPRNKMGNTAARTGNAYAGFYAYTSRYTKQNFREYIQLELKQRLSPNETYCIKAHVYLAQSSNRALPHLGAVLSRYPFNKEHQTVLEVPTATPQPLAKTDKRALTDRQWVEISTTYKATGGEQFLLIGNFDWDRDTKVTGAAEIDSFRNPNVDFAYYFVDDVCVSSLRYNFACNCGSFDFELTQSRERLVIDAGMTPKTYEVGQPQIFQDILFEKNKAIILETSHKVLDEVALILQKNPTYEIEISGHTSDKGNAEDNHFLSKRRAKSVQDYLVASGIAEKRLAYKGFGQARPIALNDSPEGRDKNERVQILLIKK
jgi:OmpA-OmpF porin, OOP family